MPNVLDRVRAAVTGDDAERIARRREIKRQLAELLVVEDRHRALGQQIRSFNQRAEEAATKCEQVCRPHREKLQATEAVIEAAILAGEAVPEAAAQQRATALEKISTETTRLGAEVDGIKKLVRQTEKDRGILSAQFSEVGRIRSRLTQPGIANPQLMRELFVANQAALSEDRRSKDAQKGLQAALDALAIQQRERESKKIINSRNEVVRELEPSAHELSLERDVENWQAEMAASGESLMASHAMRNQIRTAILAE